MKRLLLLTAAALCAGTFCTWAQDKGWRYEFEAGFASSDYFAGKTSGGIQLTGNAFYGYSFSDNAYLGVSVFGTTDFGLPTANPLTYSPDSYKYATAGLSGGIGNFTADLLWETYQENDNYMTLDLTYTISEDFPLCLEAYTAVLGDGDKDDDGKAYFSTYFRCSYDLSFFDDRLSVTPSVEYVPWNSPFMDDFGKNHWTFVGANASWSFLDGMLPLTAILGWNPTFDAPIAVLGIAVSL